MIPVRKGYFFGFVSALGAVAGEMSPISTAFQPASQE
jgi:hypothetical protein